MENKVNKQKKIILEAVIDEGTDAFAMKISYIGFDETKKLQNAFVAASILELAKKQELKICEEQ